MIPIIKIVDGSIECATKVVDAARTWGFLYIDPSGSKIDQENIDRMFDLSRKFFKSPRPEKESCAISENNHGWSSMGTEKLDPENQKRGDFKEALNFGEFRNGKAQQPLPSSLKESEHELAEFADLCHDLCLRLLRLFAIGLEIDPAEGGSEWFSIRHSRTLGETGSVLRFLYYPALPPGSDYIPETDIRAGAHSDYGSLTLLFQLPGQNGLEILKDKWMPVPCYPPEWDENAYKNPPILVNLGDLLSYWTAGLLKSTVHRVVFPHTEKAGGGMIGNDRYTIVYFCHPVDTTELVPIPSEIVKGRGDRGANVAEGKVLTAKDHLIQRLAVTYGWGRKSQE